MSDFVFKFILAMGLLALVDFSDFWWARVIGLLAVTLSLEVLFEPRKR